MPNFNDALRWFRKSKNLTQAELGIKLGVSAQVISNWERGYTTGMSPEMIANISKVLEINGDYLLCLTKFPNGTSSYFEYDNDFQDRVKSVLKEQKISNEQLRGITGIDKSIMDGYLYGRVFPTPGDLVKISNAIGVSIDWLLDNSQRMRITPVEELLLTAFEKCDKESQQYLIAEAGVLSVEGISAVAAAEYGRYLDSGKTYLSNGTGGKGA